MLDYTFDDIESYLRGSLVNKEDFEVAMETDPKLKKQVRLQQIASDLIIENRLLSVENLIKQEAKAPVFSFKKWFGAFGVVAILGLSIWLFPTFEKTDLTSSESEIITTENTPIVVENTPIVVENIPNEVVISTTIETQESLAKELPTEKVAETPRAEKNSPKENVSSIDLPVKTTTELKTSSNFIEEKQTVQKEEIIPAKSTPCDKINLKLKTEGTCVGKENGRIQVLAIDGGKTPYQKTLKNKDGELQNDYSSLEAGKYTLTVNDANNCSETQLVLVTEKFCEIEDSFNPSMGETWNIPSYKESGYLSIRNTSGTIIFEKEIAAGEQTTWDGKSKNGEIENGFLVFFIQYKNGIKQKGSVTLVR